MLNLFSAGCLERGRAEHAIRPLIGNDKSLSRPAGRVTVYQGKPIRFAQVCRPAYGTAVRASQVTELTTTSYAETELGLGPLRGLGRKLGTNSACTISIRSGTRTVPGSPSWMDAVCSTNRHQERIDFVFSDASAQLQLRVEGELAGVGFGGRGAAIGIPCLREAPVKPERRGAGDWSQRHRVGLVGPRRRCTDLHPHERSRPLAGSLPQRRVSARSLRKRRAIPGGGLAPQCATPVRLLFATRSNGASCGMRGLPWNACACSNLAHLHHHRSGERHAGELKRWGKQFQAAPGWSFLTGEKPKSTNCSRSWRCLRRIFKHTRFHAYRE